MTDDEWSAVCFFIDQGWGGFDPDMRDGYAFFLKDKFTSDEVLAGLQKLAEDGLKFRPKAAEIVTAVRGLQAQAQNAEVPSWSDAFTLMMRAISFGGRRYHDGPDAKQAKAVGWLEERSAIVARFFEAETYARMAGEGWHDEEYGNARRKMLEDRWNEFVEVAGERLARGLALLPAGRRGELGRIDMVAMIEQAKTAAPARLGPGSSDAGGTISS